MGSQQSRLADDVQETFAHIGMQSQLNNGEGFWTSATPTLQLTINNGWEAILPRSQLKIYSSPAFKHPVRSRQDFYASIYRRYLDLLDTVVRLAENNPKKVTKSFWAYLGDFAKDNSENGYLALSQTKQHSDKAKILFTYEKASGRMTNSEHKKFCSTVVGQNLRTLGNNERVHPDVVMIEFMMRYSWDEIPESLKLAEKCSKRIDEYHADLERLHNLLRRFYLHPAFNVRMDDPRQPFAMDAAAWKKHFPRTMDDIEAVVGLCRGKILRPEFNKETTSHILFYWLPFVNDVMRDLYTLFPDEKKAVEDAMWGEVDVDRKVEELPVCRSVHDRRHVCCRFGMPED